MKEWISIDDDLPPLHLAEFDGEKYEITDRILLYCKSINDEEYDGVLCGYMERFNGKQYFYMVDGASVNPTHWMYTPDPPEGVAL